MFRFIINKIKNKKWLNICLLAGIALLVAVFTCHPMLQNGAADNLLHEAFSNYAKDNVLYPAVLSKSEIRKSDSYESTRQRMDAFKAYEDMWREYVELPVVDSQKYIRISMSTAKTRRENKLKTIGIGYLDNMSEHIKIVSGKSLEESEPYLDSDGNTVFPCIMNKSFMDKEDIVVGDQIYYPFNKNSKEKYIVIDVVGVFDKSDVADPYWHKDIEEMENTVFISESVADKIALEYSVGVIECYDNLMLDYNGFNRANALDYLDYLEQFKAADNSFSTELINLLKQYRRDYSTINIVLYVLELPCVVLVLLFLYMVANQILNLEDGEMAVLRSRGVTRKQTVKLYFMQSTIISLVGFAIGIGVGILMCKAAASTDAFLSFTMKNTSEYGFTPNCILYAFIACVISIIFMTIPVIKRAKNTIVAQKGNNKYSGKVSFFEKFFVDIILIAVSIYFLVTYTKQADRLSADVIAGKRIDPMMFLNSSIFIFACGLLLIRLIRYLILLVDKIGKKKWKPATYASFLQTKRTYAKQSFIAVFIIMTMASGIFNANMARTISENVGERIKYDIGTDVVTSTSWELHTAKTSGGGAYWYYYEPDFGVYEELANDGLCESVTRVIENDDIEISLGSTVLSESQMMAINTAEFGRTASLKDGLTDEHWYNALNALALEPAGVIISSNAAKKLDVEVGKSINCTIKSPSKWAGEPMKISLTVCAIVDAFPGFNENVYTQNIDGTVTERENFLAVVNYAAFVNKCSLMPYDVWMKLSSGTSANAVKERLEKAGVDVSKYIVTTEVIDHKYSTALIQVTNGMFTMSFIISVLTASAGFLLYWIMSIKNRELLFGIYRAMGMPMQEINKMLVLEQLWGSVLPLIAGSIIGSVCTFVFAKFIGIVYLPQKHNVPLNICYYVGDVLRLVGVLLAVFFVCFVIIRKILKNMKIAQALKLGED